MSSRNRSIDEEAGVIDLTPMLDVVFIMLIFFIVTATFVKEPGIEVDRPDANTAALKNSQIFVAVNAEDEIWIDNNRVDLQMVGDQIELLLAENPKSPLVVQADSSATLKTLNSVAQAARRAGVGDVSIAAERN